MPVAKQDAYTSGRLLFELVSGGPKRAILEGLKIDNQSIYDQKIELYDCFTTDGSRTAAAGATQAGEDFATNVLSGKVRLQITVPIGEFVSLPKEDLRGIEFLGKAYAVASTTISDCVVIAQYRLK